MKNGNKDDPTVQTTDATSEIPMPRFRKREPTKLVQAKVPVSLFKQVEKIAHSGDEPTTIQAIVRWGLQEWLRRVAEKK